MIVYGNHCNCGRISRAPQPMHEPRTGIEQAIPDSKGHRGRKVMCLDTQMVYESVAEAARDMGLSRDLIYAAASPDKPNRTAGGYRFEFLGAGTTMLRIDGVEYPSMRAAARKTGISYAAIRYAVEQRNGMVRGHRIEVIE